jgi:hypothetical protein
MKLYGFRPRVMPLLVKEVASELLRAMLERRQWITASLDLGLSEVRIRLEREAAVLPEELVVGAGELERMKPGDVYVIGKEEAVKLAFYAGGKFYRLFSVGPAHAPTLEISGIHMHRIKGITPWEDAGEKVRFLGIRSGAEVLDIGTGLGYTAIRARELGAEVLTIEKDVNVLRIAELNPWSRKLEGMRIVLGDAAEVLGEFSACSFDRVMHDPPRFALAGELYSRAFYQQLFRLLRPQGLLYHYVGEPGRRRGKRLVEGVMRRLREAGFAGLRRKAMGVVARKS